MNNTTSEYLFNETIRSGEKMRRAIRAGNVKRAKYWARRIDRLAARMPDAYKL